MGSVRAKEEIPWKSQDWFLYIFSCILIIYTDSLLLYFPYSSKNPAEIFSTFNLYTLSPTIQNYIRAFTVRPFGRYLYNSFVVSGCDNFYINCFCILYGLCGSKASNSRANHSCSQLSLVWSMFPQIAIISPIYIFLRDMGLRNTVIGLVIPYITFFTASGNVVSINLLQKFCSPPSLSCRIWRKGAHSGHLIMLLALWRRR